MACNFRSPACAVGSECLLADQQGTAFCFPGECDVVKQDCTGGARCGYGQLVDGGLGRTCAAPGPQAEGAACGGANGDNCAKGLLCVSGICARYCNSDQNCTTGSLCRLFVSIPGVAEKPLVCVSVESCDPLAQTCSKGAESCYPTSSGALCQTTGSVAKGGVCGQANCVRGALCLLPDSTATSGTCRGMCNLDGGAPNCGAKACGPLNGTTEFGLCPL